jgi:uncharacterized tellurite resistance protein B-like protein
MDASELTPTEREALLVALGHVVAADEHLVHGEIAELDELGEEIGEPNLQARILIARQQNPTLEDLRAIVAKVTRPKAREWIRTFLFDMAVSDGERSENEAEVLDVITETWANL